MDWGWVSDGSWDGYIGCNCDGTKIEILARVWYGTYDFLIVT